VVKTKPKITSSTALADPYLLEIGFPRTDQRILRHRDAGLTMNI